MATQYEFIMTWCVEIMFTTTPYQSRQDRQTWYAKGDFCDMKSHSISNWRLNVPSKRVLSTAEWRYPLSNAFSLEMAILKRVGIGVDFKSVKGVFSQNACIQLLYRSRNQIWRTVPRLHWIDVDIFALRWQQLTLTLTVSISITVKSNLAFSIHIKSPDSVSASKKKVVGRKSIIGAEVCSHIFFRRLYCSLHSSFVYAKKLPCVGELSSRDSVVIVS